MKPFLTLSKMNAIFCSVLISGLTIILNCQDALAEIDHPFFYEINYNGKISYILGSQHIGVNFNELPSDVILALSSSHTLLTEVVGSPQELNNWFNDYSTAIYNESMRYQRNGAPLSEEEKDLLLTKWRMPKKLVDIALSTSCGILPTVMFPTLDQMDYQIQELSYKYRLKMISLDTYSLREAAAAADAKVQGECDVRESLKNISVDAVKEYFRLLGETYRLGNEADMIDKSPGLSIRNLAWKNEILSQVSTGGVFIDVGVAHLFGPDGLIEILKRDGATVKRLK